jgi:hypothetical protein
MGRSGLSIEPTQPGVADALGPGRCETGGPGPSARSQRAVTAPSGVCVEGFRTLRGGLLGLQGRYSGSSLFGDERLIMPITVGIPRSKHSGEPALHVKQVL